MSSTQEQELLDLLSSISNQHIVDAYKSSNDSDKKEALLAQIKKLNDNYPGGLKGYNTVAHKLCNDLKEGANPYDGWKLTVPSGTNLSLEDPQLLEYEEMGKKHMGKVVFMIMAGGLGERQGYNGVKPEITVDLVSQTSFLELYIDYALSYQRDFAGANELVPFTLFVSDDTESLLKQHMKDNNNFGLKEEQTFFVKQEKVAAFKDNDIKFDFNEAELNITTKPHGHGDVHMYLNQSGLLKKWSDEGKEYIFIFNDTNPLIFRMLPSVLGVSVKNNFVMNTITIPRVPGEAIGAISRLENTTNGKYITTNIEYNVMENLSKTLEGGKEPVDSHGMSLFPGNTNAILFHIPSYHQILSASGGTVPEFCNPKYANAEKTVFKSPARIESLISEQPRIMDETIHKVGYTQLDRMMCFTAAKNDLNAGKQKFEANMPPETASTCEHDYYEHNRLLMKWAGVEFEKSEEMYEFAGIKFEQKAKVVLMPSFATTLGGIKSQFKGNNWISAKSSLVLRGPAVIENQKLDGSLVVEKGEGIKEIKDISEQGQNYIEFVKTDNNSPQYLEIRGYCKNGGEKWITM